MPLREEPGPELEARDLPGSGLVDECLQGGVCGQDREGGLRLARAGVGRHLVGDRQQHARLQTHVHLSADYPRSGRRPSEPPAALGLLLLADTIPTVSVVPLSGTSPVRPRPRLCTRCRCTRRDRLRVLTLTSVLATERASEVSSHPSLRADWKSHAEIIPETTTRQEGTGEPDELKGSRPVRWGASQKCRPHCQ
jgi:hypothetical protein